MSCIALIYLCEPLGFGTIYSNGPVSTATVVREHMFMERPAAIFLKHPARNALWGFMKLDRSAGALVRLGSQAKSLGRRRFDDTPPLEQRVYI